jgi:hypothetical protein
VYDAKSILIEAIVSGKFNPKKKLSEKNKNKKLKPRPTNTGARKTTSSTELKSDASCENNSLYHTKGAYRKSIERKSSKRRDFDESAQTDQWKHKITRKLKKTTSKTTTTKRRNKTRRRGHGSYWWEGASNENESDNKPYKPKCKACEDEKRQKTDQRKGKVASHKYGANNKSVYKSDKGKSYEKPYAEYFPVAYKKTLGPKKDQNYYQDYDSPCQFGCPSGLSDELLEDYYEESNDKLAQQYINHVLKSRKSSNKKNNNKNQSHSHNYYNKNYSKNAMNNQQKKNQNQYQSYLPDDILLDDYLEESNDALAQQYINYIEKNLAKPTIIKHKSYKKSSNKKAIRNKNSSSRKSKTYPSYDYSDGTYSNENWSGSYKKKSGKNKHGKDESLSNLSWDSRWNKNNKNSGSIEDYSDGTYERKYSSRYLGVSEKGHGNGKSRSKIDTSKGNNNRRNQRYSEENSFSYESLGDDFFPDRKRHHRSTQQSPDRSFSMEVDLETKVSRSNFIPKEAASTFEEQSYVNAKVADVPTPTTSTTNSRGTVIDHIATNIWQDETILSSLLRAGKGAMGFFEKSFHELISVLFFLQPRN